MALRLYLVRHGESAWNPLHLYTGQQDVPLSALGVQQAEGLADSLADLTLDALYASPLKRARATAQRLADRKGMPLQLDARLVEIHHGLWEGLGVEQVKSQFAAEYAQWRSEPQCVRMPQGESLHEVASRVESFLDQLLRTHREGAVLLASHDAVLRILLLQTLGLGHEHFWKWRLDNASVSIVERLANGTFRLALLNAVHHLADLVTNCDAQAL